MWPAGNSNGRIIPSFTQPETNDDPPPHGLHKTPLTPGGLPNSMVNMSKRRQNQKLQGKLTQLFRLPGWSVIQDGAAPQGHITLMLPEISNNQLPTGDLQLGEPSSLGSCSVRIPVKSHECRNSVMPFMGAGPFMSHTTRYRHPAGHWTFPCWWEPSHQNDNEECAAVTKADSAQRLQLYFHRYFHRFEHCLNSAEGWRYM